MDQCLAFYDSFTWDIEVDNTAEDGVGKVKEAVLEKAVAFRKRSSFAAESNKRLLTVGLSATTNKRVRVETPTSDCDIVSPGLPPVSATFDH